MIQHLRRAVVAGAFLAAPAFAQSSLFTVNGDNASDTFGQSIDIVGDVNGDGFADALIGAWRDDNGGKIDSGSVRIVSGKTGATLFVVDGDLAGDHMGWGSSGAGDANGDGFADVLACADEADVPGMANAGVAKLVSGLTHLPLFTFQGDTAGDFFGWSSAHAGDVDGDGFADVVVGSLQDDATGKTNCGSAWVRSGGTGNSVIRVFGFAAGDGLGDSTGGAGDIDGDGFDDFIAGAPNADPNGASSGQALVFDRNGNILIGFDGDAAGDQLGGSVAGCGDVDLDGVPDVIIGAPADDNNGANSGTVRVISGATHFVLFALHGDAAGDQLGVAVDGAGDVDGDGYPDFVAGATGDDDNGTGCGAVRVFRGRDGSVLGTFFGDSAADALGTSVAGGYDMDGDHLADVIGGATGDDNNGSGSGSARGYSLRPTGLTLFGTGTAGCSGGQVMSGNGVPAVGNSGFALIGSFAPPSSLGFLLVSDAANLAGAPGLGTGAILHVGLPPAASFVLLGYSLSDAKGSLVAPVPIPADPLLAGFAVTFQNLSLWPASCPGLPASNVSSSNGVTAVIQP